eukprot:3414264-Pleurochrysis_carterae.AAC.1
MKLSQAASRRFFVCTSCRNLCPGPPAPAPAASIDPSGKYDVMGLQGVVHLSQKGRLYSSWLFAHFENDVH